MNTNFNQDSDLQRYGENQFIGLGGNQYDKLTHLIIIKGDVYLELEFDRVQFRAIAEAILKALSK